MISIIIVSKNEEKVLPRLLESIKKQDNIGYEIILSDAQSIDKTREIGKRYGCKIIEGGFPSKGRNEGVKYAKYKYLLFLDSDVVLPENFLISLLVNVYKKNIDCATVIYKPITNDKIIKIMYLIYNYYARFTQFFLPHSAGVCIFVKKDLFNEINGFNEKILLAEDHDFVRRASKIGKFRIIKSLCINCDVRRIEEEGKLKIVIKYLKGGILRIFKDKEKPYFDYKLHGEDKDVREIYKNNK